MFRCHHQALQSKCSFQVQLTRDGLWVSRRTCRIALWNAREMTAGSDRAPCLLSGWHCQRCTPFSTGTRRSSREGWSRIWRRSRFAQGGRRVCRMLLRLQRVQDPFLAAKVYMPLSPMQQELAQQRQQPSALISEVCSTMRQPPNDVSPQQLLSAQPVLKLPRQWHSHVAFLA